MFITIFVLITFYAENSQNFINFTKIFFTDKSLNIKYLYQKKMFVFNV